MCILGLLRALEHHLGLRSQYELILLDLLALISGGSSQWREDRVEGKVSNQLSWKMGKETSDLPAMGLPTWDNQRVHWVLGRCCCSSDVSKLALGSGL